MLFRHDSLLKESVANLHGGCYRFDCGELFLALESLFLLELLVYRDRLAVQLSFVEAVVNRLELTSSVFIDQL